MAHETAEKEVETSTATEFINYHQHFPIFTDPRSIHGQSSTDDDDGDDFSTTALGPPIFQDPSQTVTEPLTTIFTPPDSCRNRYYIQEITGGYETFQGIHSDSTDRLFWSCQPDPSAYSNIYSPGACPYLMETVAVSSFTADADATRFSILSAPTSTVRGSGTVGADLTYMDICCQSGFAWDFVSCYSVVSTPTLVLVAPSIFSRDIWVSVSRVQAWHTPIHALWQPTDISLFPPEIRRQKSSIIESGWGLTSTSFSTSSGPPISAATNGTNGTDVGDTGSRMTLGTAAIAGIAVAAVGFVCAIVTLIWLYRRHCRNRKEPVEPNTAGTGIQDPWVQREQTAELNPSLTSGYVSGGCQTDVRRVSEMQGEGKEPPAELDSRPASIPLINHGDQERGSVVSPMSDRIVSFNSAYHPSPNSGYGF
ncbi:hypothetical protein GGS20DRAFT_17724 [Poronia punctata]|nr:hypothetical protein GGS20DRAFT_17724 [Poronia punctata]